VTARDERTIDAAATAHMSVEEREAGFHDEWAESVDPFEVDVEAAWNGLGSPEAAWIASRLGSLRDKKVLDLGCGLGEASVWFALQGADVTSLDISPGMLDVVQAVAARYGVSVTPHVGSATDLSDFDDETFDVVYGANMLHHVEIPKCLDEVQRVLKVGGRAAFWDPVQYNPVIEVYRRMAMGVRTDDEHPLRRSDLAAMQTRFRRVEARGFWLTSLLIFLRFFFIDRLHPSSHRYWKLVVDQQEDHRRFLSTAHSLDRKVLSVVPPLRWVCWNMAFVCER
jgi:2-polyprenyl-3-methyl-5-hydroxy-6-metoxy-1,4-benzoquinol methylase